MTLRRKIVGAILLAALISTLMASVPLGLGAKRLVEEGSKRELETLRNSVLAGLNADGMRALAIAEMIASMPRVQRAMEREDRKGLERLFAKGFDDLRARLQIAQFAFHSENSVNVLRVQNPDVYGDDLSAYRKAVVHANATRSAVSGLERGRSELGIRGIAPIIDDGELLGVVDIGLQVTPDVLSRAVGGEGHPVEFFILPAGGVEQFSPEDTELQRLTAHYDGPVLISPHDLGPVIAGETRITAFSIGEDAYTGLVFGVPDYSGQIVAVAHVLSPSSAYAMIAQEMIAVSTVSGSLAVVIAIALAWMFGRSLAGTLQRIVISMKDLAEGNLDTELSSLPKTAELGAMRAALETFRDSLQDADRLRADQARSQAAQADLVQALAEGLRGMADGRLETRITGDFDEAYEQLIEDFNAAASGLQDVIAEITKTAGSVGASARQLDSSANDLSQRTSNSAATIEQTAAALDQITSSGATIAEAAGAARGQGDGAIEKARNGVSVVSDTVDAMSDIETSAGEIARIAGMIDEIAFQTNLLALNAGVEAARAGESGRGFAVVASEVQALAQRTSEAAGQIGSLLNASGEKVQHGVALVGRTGSALDEIVTAVEAVSNQIRRIADLAEEQKLSLSEVNTAVAQLDQVTQQNAAMFQETEGATQTLIREGDRLEALVGRFQTGGRQEAIWNMQSAEPLVDWQNDAA